MTQRRQTESLERRGNGVKESRFIGVCVCMYVLDSVYIRDSNGQYNLVLTDPADCFQILQ